MRILSPVGPTLNETIATSADVRTLAANEILFEAGDLKTCLYRVGTGAVCLYEPRWNGHHAVIEFDFPGDLVGLGFLETHACCARAIPETRLDCLPLETMMSVVQGNPKAQAKLGEAIEREFEFRRACLIQAGQRMPLARVAAFLLTLSHNNAYEGRDPSVITDSWRCGVIADYLGLSVESLSAILVELEKQGLIEPWPPASLRLKDIDAVKDLADQPVVPKGESRRPSLRSRTRRGDYDPASSANKIV